MNFDPVTLTLKSDLLLNNFNLGRHFGVMIFFIYAFLVIRPCTLYLNFKQAGTNVRGAYFIALVSASALAAWTKTLTLAITFKPEEVGLSYCTCVFLVTRPFTWYHKF